MNYTQENKLNMYLVVKAYLTGVPASILLLMPNFTLFYNQFLVNVALIRTNGEGQRQDRKGFRITKDEYKLVMVQQAVNIAARIKAYALSEDNLVLAQEMSLKKSALMYKRDTVSADLCDSVFLKGTELLTFLGDYGVTTGNLTALNAYITSFNEYIPLPRKGIVIKKNLTTSIKLLVDGADGHLESMDNLVNMLEDSEISFFREYFSSRRIVNNRGRKIALRGVVTDINGLPLQKVTVTIPELGLVVKTTINGYYEFKHLPTGVYGVMFEKAGKTTLTLPVAITSTVRVDLDAVLQDADSMEKVA